MQEVTHSCPLMRLEALHLEARRELRYDVLVAGGQHGRAQRQAGGRPAQLDLQYLLRCRLHEDRGEQLGFWFHLES